MIRTRLRAEFGRACRNTAFHACVSVSQFQVCVPSPSLGATVFVSAISRFQKRLRIRPLTELPLEVPALVHQDLAVVSEHDARALERARRRSLEVDTRDPVAAAMARALELVLRGQ